MCTVTYIPSSFGYLLASNRDEKQSRKKALKPAGYLLGDHKVFYPKDAEAGGTWIVLKENGDSLCLLNGAFQTFENSARFTVSRGQIVLQIAATAAMPGTFDDLDLQQVAPFTLIMIFNKRLFECRWDSEKKHFKELNKLQPHIWSSATLYDDLLQKKRQSWFEDWLTEHPAPDLDTLLDFHLNTGEGDSNHDLVMNRNNFLLTVSVTGIEVSDAGCQMRYMDLVNHDSTTIGCKAGGTIAQ